MREAVYVHTIQGLCGFGELRFGSHAWLRVLAWRIVNRMRRTITYATANSKSKSKIRFLLYICTSMWCCGTNPQMMRQGTKMSMSVPRLEARRKRVCRS